MKRKVLETKNLYLRPIEKSDAFGPYLNWLNDPAINQYLESRFSVWTEETLSSYIDELLNNDNEILFAICIKEEKRHIGNIKMGPINWNHRFADIGILIGDKTEWGKGRASEAIEVICQFGFDILDLNKITAGCYGDNLGSVKAFSRVGFRQEGTIKHKFNSPTGYQDHILMGILKRDFNY